MNIKKFNFFKNKKGVELAFSKIIWYIILLVFLVFVVLWYMGLRDKITGILGGVFG